MAEVIRLCLNCLERCAYPFDVGPSKGGQRDPWRETVDLCATCAEALESGNFLALHDRYRSERLVERADLV